MFIFINVCVYDSFNPSRMTMSDNWGIRIDDNKLCHTSMWISRPEFSVTGFSLYNCTAHNSCHNNKA